MVTMASLISKWFNGKELALGLGINNSVSRIGLAINALIVGAFME